MTNTTVKLNVLHRGCQSQILAVIVTDVVSSHDVGENVYVPAVNVA